MILHILLKIRFSENMFRLYIYTCFSLPVNPGVYLAEKKLISNNHTEFSLAIITDTCPYLGYLLCTRWVKL